MRRLLLTGLLALSAIMLVCVFLLAILLYSPKFNQWLVYKMTPMIPGLSIDQFDGLLLNDMHLRGLRYQVEQVDISIQSASYRLNLANLLTRKIQFDYLHMTDMDIALRENHRPKEQTPEANAFIMPIKLQLDEFMLNKLQIKQNESIYLLENIKFALLYHGQQIQLNDFSLASEILQAQGEAELSLDSQFPFTVDLMLAKSIPDLADFNAHVLLQGDSQKVDLEIDMLTPNPLHAQGWIVLNDKGDPGFDLSCSWPYLQWPLQGVKQYASENTRIILQGTVQDYSLKLESDILVKDLAAGKLQLAGRGDSEQLTLNTLKLEALAGEIQAKGRISWTDSIPSQLQLLANKLQLPSLVSAYASELSLDAQLSGRLFNKPDLRIKLKKIDGNVLDKTVMAKADIHYSAAQLLIEQLQASVGGNTFVAQGVIGDNSAMDFTLDAANLHELSSDLYGAMFAQGSIAGSLKSPEVQFEILSDGLKFQRQQLGSLLAKGRLVSADEGQIDLSVSAKKLQVKGIKINKIELQSRGKFAQHDLSVVINSEVGELDLAVQGGWRAKANDWQGRIQQLKVQGTSAGIWQLIQTAALQIKFAQAESMQLETDLCLAQISATGLVCLTATRDQTQRQQFRGNIKQLPISAFADWLPESLRIDSYLQATFSLQQQDILQGKININLDPGSIRMDHEASGVQTVAFKKAQFDTELRADNLHSELAIIFNDTNKIEGHIKSTGLEDMATASIDGLLNIKLEEIGFLGTLIDSVNDMAGEVKAQLVLRGMLTAPELQGSKISLMQGKLTIPEIGLQLNDINLDIHHAERQQIALQAKAKIADQSIFIDGQFEQSISEKFKFQMSIKGNDLKLMQTPEMQVWVSPDLRLKGDKYGAKLIGEVTIPQAMLVFESLPEGAVALSDDEVIMNAKKSEPKVSLYPVNTDIKILLGDKVSLEGFGLKTRLQGQLHAVQKKKQLKLYNELRSVGGIYKAYGQNLSIEKGQLLFNGDMENPGINILASRKASDWEDKTIAYLRMSGTLKKPLTTVYTEPALSESEALAYLLTGAPLGKSDGSHAALLAAAALSLGRDYVDALIGVIGIDEFDMKSTSLGQNSMVIGKRISSDLYARYIMDVLTSQMQFAVIYKLTQNISIETRAGTTHSSDIKYNIEFD